ncbi:nitrite reductase (NADH) large subunit [Nocardioides luteus]|uniref:assimilatory sulfite reductase (ferredoxin) n=1 Tax=Nocardioides luteus TaxID=1844 RepID=A0ABQ5SXK8_9ACTN|nr:nitrite reductase large subunit NirB [Nocardioides luteus]MDR7312671.1 nitrite reductase (NADH) large subunit [Nocardioides luteus]GGR46736.1 nitrite reductase large subunit [Nocardioides luteus]GLJ68920.1 nitrite reductase large subunit [Nocardioides luteus]
MSPHLRKKVVVVGHGMVGHRFVTAAIERGLTETHDIVVLGEEPRPAYDRVALTSFFEVGAEALSFLPSGAYEDPRVTLRTSTSVIEIDPAAQTVMLADGEEMAYDELVLATGAAPFVPPVPGAELGNVFVYRTIEDLEAIRQAARTAKAGAVIGGGLLGLEAANALHQLGVETHVVEMNPRLMSVQIDEAGGRMLGRHIADLGLTVHTSVVTESISPDAGVSTGSTTVGALKFRDVDEPLAVDMVVFSAGIRPRDALARAAGLDLAERGGVLVDEQCRSSDPHVWAVGECAAPAGRMYGLVAPGYDMAEVVADALLGGQGTFTGADMSTKLKLLGVDVASFGDAHGTTDECLELTYSDAVAGVYKKLVISEDGTRLLGGVLVGDASAYGLLRPMVASGMMLPENPEELILPQSTGGGGGIQLPPEAQVCSCNDVTRGDIEAAVDDGCQSAAEVTKATKAGSTCGSCKVQVKTIVEDYFTAQGKTVDTSLCEHFSMTRAELFDVVLIHGYKTFDQIIEAHGTGRGCDLCKPAVASILASQLNGHVLAKENRKLQDTNDAYLANLQKNGSYSVVPRIPGGEITPEGLIVIGEVAKDFGLYTKITGGQRIDMFGARMEDLPAIWKRLVDAGFESGHAYGKSLRTVKSCVGSTWCRYGVQDSVGLAIMLETRYRGLRSPHKLKGGVSGCARECAEARGKDFGVIATEKGWNLYVGGNGGAIPAHAQLLAGDLSTEELVRYLDRFLMYYVRTADRLQRTATWIDSLDGGLDRVREVVIDDVLGLGTELEAAMARHTETYFDEWKATIEDPEKLRRFVSFVNAPEVPDPNISFGSTRGQIVPEVGAEPVSLGASIPVGLPDLVEPTLEESR